MTIINWDTRTHALNFNEEIKKVYENEIKKNRKKFTSWIGKISELHYQGNSRLACIYTCKSEILLLSDLCTRIYVLQKHLLQLQKRLKIF